MAGYVAQDLRFVNHGKAINTKILHKTLPPYLSYPLWQNARVIETLKMPRKTQKLRTQRTRVRHAPQTYHCPTDQVTSHSSRFDSQTSPRQCPNSQNSENS